MAQIGDHTVRQVDDPMSQAMQPPAQFEPGPGPVVAVQKSLRMVRRKPFDPVLQNLQAQGRVADGAGNVDVVVRPGAGTPELGVLGDGAERRQAQRQRPRRRHRVAADKMKPIPFLLPPQLFGEALDPAGIPVLGPGYGQGIGPGPGAHGGQIRKVDAQKPGGDMFRAFAGGEMDAGDQTVGGDNQTLAGFGL